MFLINDGEVECSGGLQNSSKVCFGVLKLPVWKDNISAWLYNLIEVYPWFLVGNSYGRKQNKIILCNLRKRNNFPGLIHVYFVNIY